MRAPKILVELHASFRYYMQTLLLSPTSCYLHNSGLRLFENANLLSSYLVNEFVLFVRVLKSRIKSPFSSKK